MYAFLFTPISLCFNITFLQTTATFDSFLRAQELGDPDAVRLLDPLRLRYFSPEELLRIFAFDYPTDEVAASRSTEIRADGITQSARDTAVTCQEFKFTWPTTVSTKSKYKLIGNSVNVRVVQALIEYLFLEPAQI